MENLHEMQKENDLLKAQLKLKDQRIHSLEELVQYFKNQKFSPTSEKVSVKQLGLFNEAEAVEAEGVVNESTTEEDVLVKAHHRIKKPRISIPDSLPREDIDYDLAESEKFCPHDNTPLTQMGTEDHEQLDIIPAQVKVIRHRRAKYRCGCCNQYHITASKPKQPIEKGIASAGLLAYIATQKYCDELPLYRQSDIFKRSDIHLDRTNLANWMIRCGALVQPLINLLQEHALARPVIHMDETPLQVLSEPGKLAQSKSYMWLVASFSQQPVVLFHYAPTRRRDVVTHLLDEDVSALMVDGHYPIDNNLAENAIRPFTVGRKNWLFSKSQAGAKASANLYSLTETAKANKLNPYDYLRAVFTQLPNAKTVEDIEKCLPWDSTLNGN